MGLSSAPLASTSKEGPLEVASRERSYQGSLPDVHEEVCPRDIMACNQYQVTCALRRSIAVQQSLSSFERGSA